jgi:hypothetical protein
VFARPLTFFIIACALAAGQQHEANSWTGVLRNAHGDPVSGATVRLQSGDNTAAASTAHDGGFHFTVPAGEYSVAVEYGGRKATLSRPLAIPGAGSAVVLELSASGALSLAGAAQAASGGEKLSSKAVSELPLNKRDFSQLLLLAAGTMTDTNGASNFTQQFAVNGQRGTAAVFAMDGADSTDPEMGGATFTNLNVDAVQEIRSSSGVMPADVGRGAAGFTDIITRSGTDALHGSAFEFLRNSALDARNFFDERSLADPGRIPPFIRNEFGFTNGGPVTIPGLYRGRGRTFYFAEYQGFRQILSDTEIIPVPTADERAGLDTTAFPGDTLIVPVNPAIAKLLARYPLPNDPQGPYGARTYAAASRVTTFSDQFSARIDHGISDKTKLFGRFTMENTNGPVTNPSQTVIDPSFGVNFIDLQRNAVVTLTRALSASFTSESSASFTRATPGFPTADRTDPSLLFGDNLYEPFNAAGGSVIAEFGNLFQVRQNFTWIRGRHTLKAGAEARGNRDTTWFGTGPNGQYEFGGGAAYSPVPIRSESGAHDISVGDPLPDSLTGLLTGSAFTYTIGVAPLNFAQGASIGDSAIHRDAYNFYFEDSWKASSRLLVNLGLRYEIDSPIREEDKRTSDPVLTPIDGALPGSQLLINPQPPYKWDKNGWGPRLGAEFRVTDRTMFHAGGAITTLLINIWQDNLLTGSTPFVVYPRLTAAPGQFVNFGATVTPQELPVVYSTAGVPVFASGDSNQVSANTVMDVLRFEQGLAALSPSHQITALNVAGISPNMKNGYIGTWTAGVERKLGGATVDASYVGTAGVKLPVMDSPNGYPGASPGFAPYTQFDSTGAVTGGYGLVSMLTNRSHSTYDALQISAQNSLTRSGLGFQASYTFSKSLDDTSAVLGGFNAASGSVTQTLPQNPFDASADRAVSNFDIQNVLSFSLFQDLHADRLALLRPLGKTLTGGWQLLGIGTYMTGLPFTIYSGVQETGVGSIGADRPDQIGTPDLSTSRTVREDYFGLGAANASFFSIPNGRFGTLGRNTFRGPSFRDLDIAIIKDTPIGKRAAGGELASLQFRAEFFNIFNVVNFGLPSNTVLGPGFGEISRTAGTSRQIQFSLKLIY